MDSLQAVIIGSGGRITLAAPFVQRAMANLRRISGQIDRMDLQHQPENAVAAVNSLQTVIVDAADGIRPAAPDVPLTLADFHRIGGQIDRMDLQHQPEYAVAAMDGFQAVIIDAGGRIALAAPFVQRTMANLRRIRLQVGWQDSQLERMHTVAAVLAEQAVIITSALVEGTAMPHKGLIGADGLLLLLEEERAHPQHQHVDAVAAIHCFEAVGIAAAGRKAPPTPHVNTGAAMIDRIGIQIQRIGVQEEADYAVTAVLALQGVDVTPLDRKDVSVPLVVFIFAYHCEVVGHLDRMHPQAEAVHTVAAGQCAQAVGIIAGLGQMLAAPHIGFLPA